MPLYAELQTIALLVYAAAPPRTTSNSLPLQTNFPAISAARQAFTAFTLTTLRATRNLCREGLAIATQAPFTIIEDKTPAAAIARIAFAAHLAGHITQAAARLVTNGAGRSKQRGQKNDKE